MGKMGESGVGLWGIMNLVAGGPSKGGEAPISEHVWLLTCTEHPSYRPRRRHSPCSSLPVGSVTGGDR